MSRYVASTLSLLRGLVITVVCAAVFLVYMPGALAFGSTPSSTDQGTTRMDRVYEEAEKSVQPENALDGDKMIDRANRGLNEVQKDADINQMNRPENSEQATSVMDQIKQTFGKED